MNTPARNDKNIQKLENLGRAFRDGEEDKLKEKQSKEALEEVTREYPFPTARKFTIVACIGMWVFSVGALVFGVDMRGIFPFQFFALAAMVIAHLPIFWLKKKYLDTVIGFLFSVGCTWLAVALLL
ncbi:MAG: hypothetical protein FWD35_03030 [Oscillospiraceae bacterium]|nr:hypothetical protein [Oscillospiraceae bacterium]